MSVSNSNERIPEKLSRFIRLDVAPNLLKDLCRFVSQSFTVQNWAEEQIMVLKYMKAICFQESSKMIITVEKSIAPENIFSEETTYVHEINL